MINAYYVENFEQLWLTARQHFLENKVEHQDGGFHKSTGFSAAVRDSRKRLAFNGGDPLMWLFSSLQSLAGRDTNLSEMLDISPLYEVLSRGSGRLAFGPGHRVRSYFGHRQDDHLIASIRAGLQLSVIQLYDTETDPEEPVQHGNLSLVFSVEPEAKLAVDVYLSFVNLQPAVFSLDLFYYASLQELAAAAAGLAIGEFRVHCSAVITSTAPEGAPRKGVESYNGVNSPVGMMQDNSPEELAEDLADWFEIGPAIGYRTRFFKQVVLPAAKVRAELQNTDRRIPDTRGAALLAAQQIRQDDWRQAVEHYLSNHWEV